MANVRCFTEVDVAIAVQCLAKATPAAGAVPGPGIGRLVFGLEHLTGHRDLIHPQVTVNTAPYIPIVGESHPDGTVQRSVVSVLLPGSRHAAKWPRIVR